MSEEINHDRRRFLSTAAMTVAAELAMMGSAEAQSSSGRSLAPPVGGSGTSASFGALKQIDAGVLNAVYAEAGPADGPVIMLLHGWPYDIYTYVDVAPL